MAEIIAEMEVFKFQKRHETFSEHEKLEKVLPALVLYAELQSGGMVPMQILKTEVI